MAPPMAMTMRAKIAYSMKVVARVWRLGGRRSLEVLTGWRMVVTCIGEKL